MKKNYPPLHLVRYRNAHLQSTYIYKYIIQKHAINSLSGGSGAACTNLKSYSLAHKFLGICKLFSAIHLIVSKIFLFHFAFKQLCDPKLWQKWSFSALDIWFDHSYHFLNPFPGHLNIINSLFYRVILRSNSMFLGDVNCIDFTHLFSWRFLKSNADCNLLVSLFSARAFLGSTWLIPYFFGFRREKTQVCRKKNFQYLRYLKIRLFSCTSAIPR